MSGERSTILFGIGMPPDPLLRQPRRLPKSSRTRTCRFPDAATMRVFFIRCSSLLCFSIITAQSNLPSASAPGPGVGRLGGVSWHIHSLGASSALHDKALLAPNTQALSPKRSLFCSSPLRVPGCAQRVFYGPLPLVAMGCRRKNLDLCAPFSPDSGPFDAAAVSHHIILG